MCMCLHACVSVHVRVFCMCVLQIYLFVFLTLFIRYRTVLSPYIRCSHIWTCKWLHVECEYILLDFESCAHAHTIEMLWWNVLRCTFCLKKVWQFTTSSFMLPFNLASPIFIRVDILHGRPDRHTPAARLSPRYQTTLEVSWSCIAHDLFIEFFLSYLIS